MYWSSNNGCCVKIQQTVLFLFEPLWENNSCVAVLFACRGSTQGAALCHGHNKYILAILHIVSGSRLYAPGSNCMRIPIGAMGDFLLRAAMHCSVYHLTLFNEKSHQRHAVKIVFLWRFCKTASIAAVTLILAVASFISSLSSSAVSKSSLPQLLLAHN